jgi:hypothetical protein
MADPQEETPSGIAFLVGRPPLDRAAALQRRRLVRQFPLVRTRIDRQQSRKSKDGNHRRPREGVQAETRTATD